MHAEVTSTHVHAGHTAAYTYTHVSTCVRVCLLLTSYFLQLISFPDTPNHFLFLIWRQWSRMGAGPLTNELGSSVSSSNSDGNVRGNPDDSLFFWALVFSFSYWKNLIWKSLSKLLVLKPMITHYQTAACVSNKETTFSGQAHSYISWIVQ